MDSPSLRRARLWDSRCAQRKSTLLGSSWLGSFGVENRGKQASCTKAICPCLWSHNALAHCLSLFLIHSASTSKKKVLFLSLNRKSIRFPVCILPTPRPDITCLRAEESSAHHVIPFHVLWNYFCGISSSLPQLDLPHRLEITNVITLEST